MDPTVTRNIFETPDITHSLYLFLETTHVHLNCLSGLLSNGLKAKGYTGVIVTSQRSCEALGMALGLLKDETVGDYGTRDSKIGRFKIKLLTLISDL